MFSTKTAQFAWKDLSVLVAGRPITSFTDIEYSTEKTIEEIYGAGDEPQFLGEGNKVHAGTIDLLQNEFEALTEEAKKRGGDDITDLEVDLIVSFIPKGLGNKVLKTVVDRLVGVKFSKGGKKFSQGNTHMTIQVPFKFLRLEHQI